eukprot:TRINITY_DN1423_c0_g3_i1.p1 TRINITY_DN1423_c0_g3~~TRINITY_DN1423_c0_g3_i1.p1  ORF type:complete len:611 (+),score=167.81 TRINITY_DN1423_c0_g3_i1:268-1833(+)
MMDLFSNLEVIRRCHENLLAQLSVKVTGWTNDSCVGDLFLEVVKAFKLYRYYVNNYSLSEATLLALRNKNAAFQKFIARVEFTSAFFNLGLPSLMITPVQRLPRYVLLLRDMLSATPECHPDYAPLSEALEKMKDLAQYVNKRKTEADNQSECATQFEKIAGFSDPSPSTFRRRRAVRNGACSVDQQTRYLFLYTDMVVVAKTKGKDKYTHVETLMLRAGTLQQLDVAIGKKGRAPPILLVFPEGKRTFEFATQAERDDWASDVAHCVQEEQQFWLFVGEEQTSFIDNSAQYIEAQNAKNEQKRLDVLHRLCESQEEFVASLNRVCDLLVFPLFQSVAGPTPLLKQDQCDSICSNMVSLLQHHAALSVKLTEREKCFAQHGTITDIFEETKHVTAVMVLYFYCHAQQLKMLDHCLGTNQPFNLWIKDLESKHKVLFRQLLQRPISRITELYMLCAEMLQATARQHPDHEALSGLVDNLAAITEHFTHKETIAQLEAAAATATTFSTLRRPRSNSTGDRNRQ